MGEIVVAAAEERERRSACADQPWRVSVTTGSIGGMATVLLIGTKKGLWIGTSEDRTTWDIKGPQFAMQAVAGCAIDTRGAAPRLLVGASSEHWGPSVSWSDDLGASWHENSTPAIKFPEDTEASLEQVWQITPDLDGRDGVVWAGSQPSALWRSEDGGQTFDLVRGLWDHPHRPSWGAGYGGQAIHTILPDRQDPRKVLVAMSTGGVYTTADGGASWEPHNSGIHAWFFPDNLPEYGQCVHKVARDAEDDRLLYAQNHGGVYVSRDGGSAWELSIDGLPADFGFPVVAHPSKGGTAYVVPLSKDADRYPPGYQLQVARTDDGGRSWAASSQGLPGDFHAVVLRDAFTTDGGDPAGLYLGARDGTVYASADEGTTWTQLADHLPDVLCIRAATL
jgi:photosystem II stability/assembly factor-like uncharacterized protein